MREPEKDGSTTPADIEKSVIKHGQEIGTGVDVYQSNHEGNIVDTIQNARAYMTEF